MIIYNELTEKEKREIENWFCVTINCKKQRITDSKFLKILKVCWKHKVDMNFDDNPDFEDLQCIRASEFKYHVLNQLCCFSCDSNKQRLYSDIKQVLNKQ